jgi:hypothetical protein
VSQQAAVLAEQQKEIDQRTAALAAQEKAIAQTQQRLAKQQARILEQQVDYERRLAELEEKNAVLKAQRQALAESDRQYWAEKISLMAMDALKSQPLNKGTPQGVPLKIEAPFGPFFVKLDQAENLLEVVDADGKTLLQRRGADTQPTTLLERRHVEELRQWDRERQNLARQKLQKDMQR